jgi:hypothetical protein
MSIAFCGIDPRTGGEMGNVHQADLDRQIAEAASTQTDKKGIVDDPGATDPGATQVFNKIPDKLGTFFDHVKTEAAMRSMLNVPEACGDSLAGEETYPLPEESTASSSACPNGLGTVRGCKRLRTECAYHGRKTLDLLAEYVKCCSALWPVALCSGERTECAYHGRKTPDRFAEYFSALWSAALCSGEISDRVRPYGC